MMLLWVRWHESGSPSHRCTRTYTTHLRVISALGLLLLFRAASKVHGRNVKLAMAGQGFDRHLFGLRLANGLMGNGPLDVFSDHAYQMPFKLSTTQVAGRQAPEWGGDCSYPGQGGAFVNPLPDGYGIVYMIAESRCAYIHVTANKSCVKTDAQAFSNAISAALTEIAALE
eukprot:m.200168 g.200168  ORF g.200168 m.200168 type:complete len:171 (+) comp18401_c0_seq2:192-704(+)